MSFSRKGEGVGLPYLLGGIVAIVLLIIIFIFLFGNSAFHIDQYLPSFLQDHPVIKDVEKLRYVISDNTVQYYNEKKWLDFPKGTDAKRVVQLNNKILVYGDLAITFKRFYFNEDLREPKNNPLFNFIMNNPSLPLDKNNPLKPGDVIIFVKRTGDQFVLNNDNVLKRYRLINVKTELSDVDFTSGLYQTAKDRSLVWRDSILKNSVVISYTHGDDQKTKDSVTVCVTKIGKDLVVDLTQPVSGSCSGMS